jgi:hypothetical protein
MLNKTDFEDISVTFAVNGRMEKLFRYLRKERCFKAEENASGIYRLIGDKLGLAIQFICRKRLSGDDNPWLAGLGNDLGEDRRGRIVAEYTEMDRLRQENAKIRRAMEAKG